MKNVIKVFMPVKVGDHAWFIVINMCSNGFFPIKREYKKNDLQKPFKTKYGCQIECDLYNSKDGIYFFGIIIIATVVLVAISLIAMTIIRIGIK